jgi:hypothetical protein
VHVAGDADQRSSRAHHSPDRVDEQRIVAVIREHGIDGPLLQPVLPLLEHALAGDEECRISGG